MPHLGITGAGAKIIGQEQRGEERIVRVLSRGLTRRAAVRGARVEASSVIPIRDQDVLNTTEDRVLSKVSTRYLISIGHNEDY